MRFLGLGIGHQKNTAAPPFNATAQGHADADCSDADPNQVDGARDEDEENLAEEEEEGESDGDATVSEDSGDSGLDSDNEDIGFDNF